jgi:hypothetical protein
MSDPYKRSQGAIEEDKEEIIRQFVEQAPYDLRPAYFGIREVPLPDWERLNAAQRREWFLANGLVDKDGNIDAKVLHAHFDEDGPELDEDGGAWDVFMDGYAERYAKKEGWATNESRKYSSFKSQQTITENFRRFLKK